MSTDPFTQFKSVQRESWANFAPLEAWTTIPAAELVRFAGVTRGQRVLDVGSGTGVVAVTAARAGAEVRGLDLSPALVAHARANASLAGLPIDFVEGDAEALPYEDASFDVVLSQFGHMFAPRADVAIAEMTRVLRPGGLLAFSTWPPELFVGQIFATTAKYMPPPPGITPPPSWGDPATIRQRLGDGFERVVFDRAEMIVPVLSKGHYRHSIETTVGPVIKLVAACANEPERLAAFRADIDALMELYWDGNTLTQHFVMTRARKK